jgi:hypothetical protein
MRLAERAEQRGDDYGVGGQTTAELERVRRDLRTGLAVMRSHFPARVPMESHLRAVDAELNRRDTHTSGEDRSW